MQLANNHTHQQDHAVFKITVILKTIIIFTSILTGCGCSKIKYFEREINIAVSLFTEHQ